MKDEGGEDPYDTEAQYEEKPVENNGIYESWDFFCEDVSHRARFFSQNRQEFLDFLFRDLEHLRTYANRPIIRSFGHGTSDRHVYRARRAMDHGHLIRIMRSPAVELGPPRGRLAKAGRMNASGISVFFRDIRFLWCSRGSDLCRRNPASGWQLRSDGTIRSNPPATITRLRGAYSHL